MSPRTYARRHGVFATSLLLSALLGGCVTHRGGDPMDGISQDGEERESSGLWEINAREISESYSSVSTVTRLIALRFPESTFTCAPLIVVDGRPTDENEISGMHPSSVARIKALRHDYETAIYGFRGSCGVLEITRLR